MKRIIIVLVVVFFTIACQSIQPNDTKAQINGKDSIAPTESAQIALPTHADGGMLRERTEVPEHYTQKMVFEEDTLTINFEAIVEVPDVESVSVLEVAPRGFVQKDIDGLIALLFKNVAIYDVENLVDTKSATPSLSDGTLRNIEQNIVGSNASDEFYGLSVADEDFTKNLRVNNGEDGDVLKARLVFEDNTYPSFNHTTPKEMSEMPEDIRKSMAIGSDEAEVIIKDALFSAGINNMYLYRAYYVSDGQVIENTDKTAIGGSYAYLFVFSKMIENVPLTFDAKNKAIGEHEQIHRSWDDEQLEIILFDNHITYLRWNSPVKIIDKVDTTQILEFNEMMTRLNKAIAEEIKTGQESKRSIRIVIEKISLEYQLTDIDRNALIGTMTPVWNFYGHFTDDSEHSTSESKLELLLSVSAVDGAMIDHDLGY